MYVRYEYYNPGTVILRFTVTKKRQTLHKSWSIHKCRYTHTHMHT